jgi:recombination protein RecT
MPTSPPTTRRRSTGSTAVATRPPEANPPAARAQHPSIAKLDERMPQIVELLPAGMDGRRFKGVVFQALLKNRDLFECTFESIFTSVREAAEAGLEPTGTLGRAWLLPYNVNVGTRDNPQWEKQARLIIGYRGFAELAWRADRVLFTVEAVRSGDQFSYQRGTKPFLHHTPDLEDAERETDDDNITYVYSIASLPDGRADFEVMSWAAVERIRDRAKKRNPVWATDPGEMSKKTVLRRHVKRLPLSAQMQRYLAEDEEIDFDTPVERIPAAQVAALPHGASRTAQASARAAALQGDVADEPPPEALDDDGPEPEQEPEQPVETAVDDLPFDGAAVAVTDPEAGVVAAAPCDHRATQKVAAGVVCTQCGELLARYADAAPERVTRAKAGREALMARIHVGRDHGQARALAARVLGLADDETWSMADLLDDELQAVIEAIRDEDSRRMDRPMRRPQPAAAGARSR